MRVYLKNRIRLLNESFDLSSAILWGREGRNLEPKLIAGDSDISRALEVLKALETEARKLSRGQRKKLARRRTTAS